MQLNRTTRLVAALVLGWLGTATTAADDPPMVVGVIVHHEEVGTLDLRQDDAGYLVPLRPFALLARMELERLDRSVRLRTPLGPIEIPDEELREREGVLYIRQQTIERTLATPVRFDRALFAITFELPWRIDSPDPLMVAPDPIPDATPPGLSLSTIQSDMRYARFDEADSFGSSTLLGGRMADGYWRLRYQDDLEGRQQLRDYSWFTSHEHWLLMAGHQTVRLHPLLSSIEMTGAQLASTNAALDRFGARSDNGNLISRNVSPVTSIRGPGPAAGIAELWINDRLVQRQMIGLDGSYEFDDVSLPVRQASNVEVRVYDRQDPRTPVAIHEETRNASEFLLDDGVLVQLGGLGRTGNALDSDLQSGESTAGFYQTRYGVSDGFTVEAALQRTRDRTQLFTGFVSRLGRPFVLSLGASSSGSAAGYRIELDGRLERVRLQARSLATEEEFFGDELRERYEHAVELFYEHAGRFAVGLVGESWKDDLASESFLLPAFGWRAHRTLSMRGRPDHYAEYRFDLSYRPLPSTQIQFSTIGSRTLSDFSQRLGDRFQLGAEASFGADQPSREAAYLSFRGEGRRQPGWSAGATRTDGEPGYLLAGSMQIIPGVAARLQYESDPILDEFSTDDSRRLLVNVNADLGLSQGRIHAARSTSIRGDLGGVTGRVRIEADPAFARPTLEGIPVLIDERVATRTQVDGSFFVGALRPGVYRLSIEIGSLPIELVPTSASLNVEIAAAAVTRADFRTHPEFGAAGRVLDASGEPVAELPLLLFDAEERPIRTLTTDRFGLYRVDGLRSGRYTLRPATEIVPPRIPSVPQRVLEIEFEFLFDQDLRLTWREPRQEDQGRVTALIVR